MQPFNIENATVYLMIPDGFELVYLGGVYGSVAEDSDGQAAVWMDQSAGSYIAGYRTADGVAILLAALPMDELHEAEEQAENFAFESCRLRG